MRDLFGRWKNADIVALVDENPLAWVLSNSNPSHSALLPLLMECDENGTPTSLLGHIPKRHQLMGTFTAGGEAEFLFLGPHSYISPEALSEKNWAPTWNFAQAHIRGFAQSDDGLTEEALEKLVAHMEKGRRQPWSVSMLGERYGALRSRVIGFRAAILDISARFKLGQDENATVLTEILNSRDDSALVSWMKRFRP